MSRKIFVDFTALLEMLVCKEKIMTKGELLLSSFKDDYWLLSYELARLITGYRRKNINKSDSLWDFDDYMMELTKKIVDKYDTLIESYSKNPEEFSINGYVTSMLIKMIITNSRKRSCMGKKEKDGTNDKNADKYYICSINSSLDDDGFTIEETLTSDEDTEETCIFRSNVRQSAEKLNRLSSKGPLYAFVLTISGDKDLSLELVHDLKIDFLDVYNNEIDIFCNEYGIKDSKELKTVNLSDFSKAFSPADDFNTTQISRWKYMCKNELGSQYGIDTSPKQKRKSKVTSEDSALSKTKRK